MKPIKKCIRVTLLLTGLLAFSPAFSQCGIYLSLDDYLNNRLTDECKSLSIPPRPGDNDHIVLLTAKGSKTYTFADVWGFKDGYAEYRILNGWPHVIICRGAIVAYTPYGPIKEKNKKIVYHRADEGFGQILVAKDINDPYPVTCLSHVDLWQQFPAKQVPELKAYYGKLSSTLNVLEIVPEMIIDFYNSTRPGYVPPVYSEIKF